MRAWMRREAGEPVGEPTTAGWYRDPFGRHEKRYHTGTGWTEHVKDRKREGIDPPFATLSEQVVAAPPPPAMPLIHARPTPIETARRTARVPERAGGAAIAKAPGTTTPGTTTPAANKSAAKTASATTRSTKAPAVEPAPGVKPRAHQPRPVIATPMRTARPPVAPVAAAPAARPEPEVVAPRTLHKRPPSSYLKPAPAMRVDPPAEEHRPRWPWVLVSIVVLLGILLATGIGLIGGGTTEPRTVAPPALPKRAPHTLTPAEYSIVAVGTDRARVVDGLDKLPAPPKEYRAIFPGAKTDPECIYYYAKTAAGSYTLCFGEGDTVVSKTTVKHRRVASR